MLPHYVNIYTTPRQGGTYIRSDVAMNYKHRIVAKGGFESASWTGSMSGPEAEVAFSQYIGSIVRIYVDNPEESVWEGYITRMTWRVGGVAMTRAMDNMMNRVTVTYYNVNGGALKTEQTVAVDNLTSQALYGIYGGSINGELHYNANVTHKTVLRNTMLAERAFPQVSTVPAEGGSGLIEFEAKGLAEYVWDHQVLKVAAAAATLAGTYRAFEIVTIQTPGPAFLPDNAPYVYLTGPDPGLSRTGAYNDISFSAPYLISNASEGGQTYMQFLMSIAEAGDGAAQFSFGVGAYNSDIGSRLVYFKPANRTIKYTAQGLADNGRVRDLYGNVVPPYLVRPDAGIRISDVLAGWDLAGDDPRIGYISEVNYDAEAETATWQTGDNITMEGALQKDRKYKDYHSRNAFASRSREII